MRSKSFKLEDNSRSDKLRRLSVDYWTSIRWLIWNWEQLWGKTSKVEELEMGGMVDRKHRSNKGASDKCHK